MPMESEDMDQIATPATHAQFRPRRVSAREALEELGGIAGAKAIADKLDEVNQASVTVRQVRDRFRNTGGAVRKLGAGYFATRRCRDAPVGDFVQQLISSKGAMFANEVCGAILAKYPNGDERAVLAWLYQDPGPIAVRDDRVFVVAHR